MNKDEHTTSTSTFWCKRCNTPVLLPRVKGARHYCPICQSRVKHLCSDLRPVFPEERLLIELLLDCPMKYTGKSVWASKTVFYVDGMPLRIPRGAYDSANIAHIRRKYEQLSVSNPSDYFLEQVDSFVRANGARLEAIVNEATDFVREVRRKYPDALPYISFSGGKDSTVTSYVVQNALPEGVLHVFCDTTLEFPQTYEYADRFAQETRMITARNTDCDFYEMCNTIGPPSRNMRWCCTMFKTGPITRVLDKQLGRSRLLSFLGVRKAESNLRSRYSRINEGDRTAKIQGQVTASPIFEWKDLEVWLCILSKKLDFNSAYKRGYNRVGCYCCPNNSDRNQFLTSVFAPDMSERWNDTLLTFAKKAGKPDPAGYVSRGYWKARIGGQGLSAANRLKIRHSDCAAEENAVVYALNRPADESFWNLFTPLGEITKGMGRKLLDEVIVLDHGTHYPLISISPHNASRTEIKIRTFNGVNHREIQRQCGYQIRKYNICLSCLKCEAVCGFKAISVTPDGYRIDASKCRHCLKCVSNKYLVGGCMMYRYLFDSEKIK